MRRKGLEVFRIGHRRLHQAVVNNTFLPWTQTFNSVNPATGVPVGEAADCSVPDTLEAIESARVCFKNFKYSLAHERAKLLTNWAGLILENSQKLAKLITKEMGKPVTESLVEIGEGTGFLYQFAAHIQTGLTGGTLQRTQAHWRPIKIRQPVGPVATITPSNFPVSMVTRKAGAAIAAGCSVINVPSEDTPLVALFMARLAVDAGFPEGLFNVLPSSHDNKQVIGLTLCEHPDIAVLSFTGSTAVGKQISIQCAGSAKRVHLELGGNAPLIVFESADIDRAVASTMIAKFENAGQSCFSPNRIMVHKSVYSEYVEKLAKKISSLTVGYGLDKGVTIGPLVNKKGLAKVERLVKESVASGKVDIVVGSTTQDSNSPFYSPTLLSLNDQIDNSIFHEEIFGPVAAIYSFETEEEAVHLANHTRYGLHAYIFTRDLAQSWRVSEDLECGIVAVNEGVIRSVNHPFGGWKESGMGRDGGHLGIDEFTKDKLICFGL